MSKSELPKRASLEYLKRRAKERLAELRMRDPQTKLAGAQLEIARELGFASWRALKTEIDAQRAPLVASFFAACKAGDVPALRALLDGEPALVAERSDGSTGLHVAVGHVEAVRLLIARGADPNARDDSDNAYPLHRAGTGESGLEVVRALLDAGGDVHGSGDAHRLEVIGWHTCFQPTFDRAVLALLLERGARHHIFSAIATGDADAIQKLVEQSASALHRRLARSEQSQTALHYVIAPPDGLVGGGFRTGAHHALLELLIELGSDLEATDDAGRTPLAVAMLRGDTEAMQRLQAAGARVPARLAGYDASVAALARSVKRLDVMMRVPDIRAAIEWYRVIGFVLAGEHELDTPAAWAGMAFGDAYLMLVPGGTAASSRETSFWVRTDQVDELHRVLKQRQLERASAVLAGDTPAYPEARFSRDLHDTWYGDREFSIVDLNGYELTFTRP
jgi:ankyrin repeat protein